VSTDYDYDAPPQGGTASTGVTPPHSLEAEQAVLGAILLSEKLLYSVVIEIGLRPQDFYRERHAVVFEAMLELYNEGEPIDVLTVTDRLEATSRLEGIGGATVVDELAGPVPVVGNLRRYGEIVREQARMRRLLTSTYEIQASVMERAGTPEELIERAERSILEIAHDDETKDFSTVGSVLDREVEVWSRLSREGVTLTGTTSGFRDLDEITGGFQPGNLIIIAARPSMGKSAFVTNVAENVALNPKDPRPVALFSLEMAEAELAQRFIASQSRIDGDKIRKGKLKNESDFKKVIDAANRFHGAPLFIDDSSDIGTLEIRAKARRLQQQHGQLGMIIIDYLQLMRPDARIENRVQQVGEMSRGLKILARELQVPVIALSQLSRGVESRTDKRPLLSDLRESGQIEQDADLVMFIYRDEYYNPETTEAPGEGELIIGKHRNGGLGTVHLTFLGKYPKFMSKSHDS
jgi:replicative DNA helicase